MSLSWALLGRLVLVGLEESVGVQLVSANILIRTTAAPRRTEAQLRYEQFNFEFLLLHFPNSRSGWFLLFLLYLHMILHTLK
jgi:hypothetical protein